MSHEILKLTARSKDLDLSRKHSSHWIEFQLMVISAKCRKIIKDKETHLSGRERNLRCFSAAELSGSSASDLPDDSFNLQTRSCCEPGHFVKKIFLTALLSG